MSFQTKMVDGTAVVAVTSPRATIDIANEFKDSLLDLIEEGKTHVVVDLSETEFVDSSFLGALVTGLKRATSKDGDVRISGLQPSVRAMLELTRLYRIFDIFDNVDEAVASFKN